VTRQLTSQSTGPARKAAQAGDGERDKFFRPLGPHVSPSLPGPEYLSAHNESKRRDGDE
jgi:hypothetical protein